MKFCQPHWNKLRAAIDARGLGHLGAKSGAEAVEAIVLELEGRPKEAMPDPLMTAHNMIVQAVGNRVGIVELIAETYGPCPVCVGMKTNEGAPDSVTGRIFTPEEEESYWIDGPADAVLAIFAREGLV